MANNPTTRFIFSLSEDTSRKLDNLVEQTGALSRAEVVRYLIKTAHRRISQGGPVPALGNRTLPGEEP